jgi:hypothetical protein
MIVADMTRYWTPNYRAMLTVWHDYKIAEFMAEITLLGRVQGSCERFQAGLAGFQELRHR